MMQYVCDRCGKKIYKEHRAGLCFESYNDKISGIFHWCKENEHFDFDLCGDCSKEFCDWIRNKDKHMVS